MVISQHDLDAFQQLAFARIPQCFVAVQPTLDVEKHLNFRPEI
jgi:hypothetical protein